MSQKEISTSNCSPQNFILLQRQTYLTSYTFKIETDSLTFCSICGIHSFYYLRSHPDMIDVNVRTLDRDLVSIFKIQPFDRRNWKNSIDKIKN